MVYKERKKQKQKHGVWRAKAARGMAPVLATCNRSKGRDSFPSGLAAISRILRRVISRARTRLGLAFDARLSFSVLLPSFLRKDPRHRTRAEQKSGAGCTGILIRERAPAKRVLKCRFYCRQSAYSNSLSGSANDQDIARFDESSESFAFESQFNRLSLDCHANPC